MYGAYRNGTVCEVCAGDDDIGSTFASEYVTAWQAIQETDHRKRMTAIDVMFGDAGGVSLSLDIGWDYSESYAPAGTLIRTLGEMAAGGWDVGLWSDQAIENAWPGVSPAGIALWNKTTKMAARYATNGSGFLYRVRLSAPAGFVMHLSGWRPHLEDKGTR